MGGWVKPELGFFSFFFAFFFVIIKILASSYIANIPCSVRFTHITPGHWTCSFMMDDTVIMASTRDKCLTKVGIVLDYCESHGMFLNAHKTQFMVINGSSEDRIQMELAHPSGDIVIDHCEKYTYLGSIFTAEHVKDKSKHLLKLIAFFRRIRISDFMLKEKY